MAGLDINTIHNDDHQSGYVYANFGEYNVRGRKVATPMMAADAETTFKTPGGYFNGVKSKGRTYTSPRKEWRSADEKEVVTWSGLNQWQPASFSDRLASAPGVMIGSTQWYQKGQALNLGSAVAQLDNLHDGYIFVRKARYQAPGPVAAAAMQVVTNEDGSKTKFLKAIFVELDSIQASPNRAVLKVGCWARNMTTGETSVTPNMFPHNAPYQNVDAGYWSVPIAVWNQAGTEAKVAAQGLSGGIYVPGLKTVSQASLGSATFSDDPLTSYGLPAPYTTVEAVGNVGIVVGTSNYYSGSGSYHQESLSLSIQTMGYVNNAFACVYGVLFESYTDNFSGSYEVQTNPGNPIEKFYAQTTSSISRSGTRTYALKIYRNGVHTTLQSDSGTLEGSGTHTEYLEANTPSPPNQTWTRRVATHDSTITFPNVKSSRVIAADLQSEFYAWTESYGVPGNETIVSVSASSGGYATNFQTVRNDFAATDGKIVVSYKGVTHDLPVADLPWSYSGLSRAASSTTFPNTGGIAFGQGGSSSSTTYDTMQSSLSLNLLSAEVNAVVAVPNHSAFITVSARSQPGEPYYTTPVHGLSLAAKQAKPEDGGGISFERLDGAGYLYTGFHLFFG